MALYTDKEIRGISGGKFSLEVEGVVSVDNIPKGDDGDADGVRVDLEALDEVLYEVHADGKVALPDAL